MEHVNSNSNHVEWKLSQDQIEGLLCRGYAEIFTIICDENKAMKFADDTQTEFRLTVINKVLKKKSLSWPEKITPKVRLYTLNQFRETGILLGRNEIIFSWPRRSEGGNSQEGDRTTSIRDQRCFESSNVKKLVNTDFPLDRYLPGRVIADVLEIFEETIFLSLQHPAIAKTLIDNPEETKSLFRKSYVQRYSRQLPRNLKIEFDNNEKKYFVICNNNTDSEDKTVWTLVLPMMLEESGNELASPPLRFYPSVDGCDPPCKEAESKS